MADITITAAEAESLAEHDELVKRLKDDEAWKNCDFDFIYDWMHEAADAIEELLSERDEVNADSWKTAFEVERDEHRWIPVTERLPEEAGFTLIFTANGNPGVCYFTNGWWGGYSKDHITHWMPLPEPPKEE